ncbi:MAG: hypothetical protein WC310_03460 [Patescibacteria group bacterium]|jgi:hypothetical protein
MKLCHICKSEIPENESKTLEFHYQGFPVKIVTTIWNLVCLECEKTIWIKKFQESIFAEQVIVFSHPAENQPTKMTIDWKKLDDIKWSEKKEEVLIFLQNLGILSAKKANNWQVISDEQMPLGPRRDEPLSFTSAQHAADYAKALFANTFYNWNIVQFGKVLSKDEALQM